MKYNSIFHQGMTYPKWAAMPLAIWLIIKGHQNRYHKFLTEDYIITILHLFYLWWKRTRKDSTYCYTQDQNNCLYTCTFLYYHTSHCHCRYFQHDTWLQKYGKIYINYSTLCLSLIKIDITRLHLLVQSAPKYLSSHLQLPFSSHEPLSLQDVLGLQNASEIEKIFS